MLLRASGELSGETLDVSSVTAGRAATSGVSSEQELIAFTEAAVRGDPTLPQAREAVEKALGAEALVDAAAVVGNFERMTRIADGTGIPLDAAIALVTADMREELGIDAFGSASETPPVRGLRRLLGRALRPALPLMMRAFRPR